MKNFFLIAGLAIASALIAEDAPRYARVDFSSSPEGAEVAVDGKVRGVTPLTLFDIEGGRHRAHYSFRGYETADDFFTVAAGALGTSHATLAPTKGLLLVTSEPAGAELSLDGVAIGETPRLVTTLDVNRRHRFTLKKTGYQPKTFEVKFSGREPIARNEKLVLDSGLLKITTEPAGAKVMVNGIDKGVTPLELSGIPRGRATVKLELAGYAPVVREVSLNAGDKENLYVALEGVPGTLNLSSVPAGARFYLNDAAQGKGPVTIKSLAPGEYRVRAELEGYAMQSRTVSVGRGATVNEEFRMADVRGRLELKSNPPGVKIYLDDRFVGVTKSNDPEAEVSDIFAIDGVEEGEHVVAFRKDGYKEVVIHPEVRSLKTTKSTRKLKRIFKPDVEVETSSGVHRGIMVENLPEMIIVETRPGVSETFMKSDIRRVKTLIE